MELSSLKNKKYQKGTFQAQKIIKKPTQRKFLIFGEMELFSVKLKKLLYFRRELSKLKKQTFYILCLFL